MYDFHMHTTFSDGKNSIEEMVLKAQELKLQKIAITDHIWRTSAWFDEYCNQINKINKENSEIDILIGFEAKALSINGEIDATEYMCKKADIRIGAMHRIPTSGEINKYMSKEDIRLDKTLAYNNWLKTTEEMIKNDYVDIIAHPLMVLFKYKIAYKREDIIYLFNLAKTHNKKLEISMRYKGASRVLVDILEEFPYFLNILSYGSDAHSVNELNSRTE